MPMAEPASAPRPMRFRRQVVLSAVLVATPMLLAALALVLSPVLSYAFRWLLIVLALLACAALLYWHLRRVVQPLSTLASLLEALREGDYTLRGVAHGALGQAIFDVNALAEHLQAEHVRFEEASHLLRKTLAALDSAVFVFDGADRLSLVNSAGQRLLQGKSPDLFGHSVAELGMQELFAQVTGSIITRAFPGRSGRFEVRHSSLRQDGCGGRLLVISDLDRVLRDEERLAWQRLLRVLGHEINNSLAPIQSIAGTLAVLLQREPLPEDWRTDMDEGLGLISRRADALARFLSSYSRLARLPPPQRRSVDLAVLVSNVTRLQQEAGVVVVVEEGPALPVQADGDQIEQALINLLRNAIEAQAARVGNVLVRWRSEDSCAVVEIIDQGPGPPPSANLFVPFFTTKSGGSGIGLVLARQITEAHGGSLMLEARPDGPGARVRLLLPLNSPATV